MTTWSPQGRLFQVEYAMEAVKQGSCAVGLKVRQVVGSEAGPLTAWVRRQAVAHGQRCCAAIEGGRAQTAHGAPDTLVKG